MPVGVRGRVRVFVSSVRDRGIERVRVRVRVRIRDRVRVII